ncbi:LysR family transcriptional regulator [Acidocella sp.]|uniref:LysR family transcriptional regulator n=1 Tax=Acidocella sp. TaxID=50710 RepID=UPI002629865E|nr:LysR family transcriptional regulator [Acidocella sp.]
MLEAVTLDQLRMFVAAVEQKSFSGAGRVLGRAQSVVSQAVAGLEDQLGVKLFSRESRTPALTPEGELLLADARAVLNRLGALKARAKGMSAGVEPELSVAVDVMFPMSVLTRTAAAFGEAFPFTPLRLYVEALGGVAKAVLEGQCQLGIVGSLPFMVTEMVSERLLGVELVLVAAPSHRLAQQTGRLSARDLAGQLQLVLTDRTELSRGREFNVFSSRTWRLADMGAKHAFLLAGLGWGGMPMEMVADDLAAGRLVALTPEDHPARDYMTMSASYLRETPPGPAGRWFIERLKAEAG